MIDKLGPKEIALFRKLDTPQKIQDFLDNIPVNFEPEGDTCLSPRMVLKQNRAHCIEGALLAALILRFHGHTPLLVDLETTRDDFDHVLAIFKQHGHWGAISKTNHAVLRYREPVYRSLRELVMSFFHEYFKNDTGEKTLRRFSKPINLKIFDDHGWMTSEEEVWYIAEHLAQVPHVELLSQKQIKALRPATNVERRLGSIVEWEKNGKLSCQKH
ncbi:hypothetical protein HYT55_03610 [Candidatus Woesearchaeota archaeon]|nr:hypothetical protein [Candidatus Woesearchaeota archaeon]